MKIIILELQILHRVRCRGALSNVILIPDKMSGSVYIRAIEQQEQGYRVQCSRTKSDGKPACLLIPWTNVAASSIQIHWVDEDARGLERPSELTGLPTSGPRSGRPKGLKKSRRTSPIAHLVLHRAKQEISAGQWDQHLDVIINKDPRKFAGQYAARRLRKIAQRSTASSDSASTPVDAGAHESTGPRA